MRELSHGAHIGVSKGPYYLAATFGRRVHEWEENDRVETGLLGVTKKHVTYTAQGNASGCGWRIWRLEPYAEGIGIMRYARSRKPQTFLAGDAWFIYNLGTNLNRP